MTLIWEDWFRRGIEAFRSLDFERALRCFDAAISDGGESYIVYDSRAAVYEKMGKTKDALRDSRRVIELAPHLRHGYTRSAQLFLLLGKHDSALAMVQLALDRLKTNDTIHRTKLNALQEAIHTTKNELLPKILHKKTHIHELPVELISEIFILSAETDNGSPLCVSLVCSHWRQITLSIPALWKRIVISDIRPVRKLELWQDRSRGQITNMRIREGISRLQLQEVLDKCRPSFFKTLKCFHCEVDLALISTCLMITPNAFELDLEDIQVSVPSNQRTNFITSSLIPLIPSTRTSNARSLVAEYLTLNWTEVVPKLIHLRILVIRTSSSTLPSTGLLFALFEANQYLEEVTLETRLPWELDAAGTDERKVLPYLYHLELLGPMDAGYMVAHLSLPNIKHFAISQCLRAADEVIFAFDAFPAFTELSIHKCSFSERRLASLLQRMQTLTKLEITHSANRMDVIVDAIAVGPQGGTVLTCPKLRHVDFSHSQNLNGGPIVRLVEPRLRFTHQTPGAPTAMIDILLIDGCPKVDPSVPEWLRSRVKLVSCVYMSKQDIRKLSRRAVV